MNNNVEPEINGMLNTRTGKRVIATAIKLFSRENSPIACKSINLSNGLLGVSTQIMRVFGRMFFFRVEGSDRSKK